MNKAFVKEDAAGEDEDFEDEDKASPSGLALGARNYITPQGFDRLKSEFVRLKTVERPEVTKVVQWAAGNGDRSENGDYLYGKKKLREIDKRLRYLAKRMESAEVIDPIAVKSDQIMFGATVTIRDEDDNQKTYSIVGVDELDIQKGKISWMSPLAGALMKAREGDTVTFRFPKGVQELEVLAVEYKEIPG